MVPIRYCTHGTHGNAWWHDGFSDLLEISIHIYGHELWVSFAECLGYISETGWGVRYIERAQCIAYMLHCTPLHWSWGCSGIWLRCLPGYFTVEAFLAYLTWKRLEGLTQNLLEGITYAIYADWVSGFPRKTGKCSSEKGHHKHLLVL